MTPFAETLLYDPSARLPFFAAMWTLVSILYVAIAHEAAGKGTWTALATRPLALPLALCLFAAAVAVTKLKKQQLKFVGLLIFCLWACPTIALMGTQHRAVWLLVFVG